MHDLERLNGVLLSSDMNDSSDRKKNEIKKYLPITTVMLDVITSVTERPTYAQAYCVAKFPRLRTTPPAMANRIQGQLS